MARGVIIQRDHFLMLHRQQYLQAHLYLKQDIRSDYAMVDFICIGLTHVTNANQEL